MAMAACPRLAGDTWSGWSLTRAAELFILCMVGSSSHTISLPAAFGLGCKFLLLLPLLSATGCGIGCYCTFSILGAARRCVQLAGDVGFLQVAGKDFRSRTSLAEAPV